MGLTDNTSGMMTDTPAQSDATPCLPPGRPAPRVLIWYEGRGDTTFRISDRIARWLGRDLPADHIGLATSAGDDFVASATARGNRVYRFKGPHGRQAKLAVLLNYRANHRRFAALLDEFRPDVVILAMNFAPAWPLVRLLGPRGIKLVYLPHDPEPHQGDFLPLWQTFAQNRVLAHADHLVLMSDEMLRRARQIGGRFASLPASVIALHSIGFPVTGQPRAVVSGRKLRFLFLGRMIAYKGLDLLAGACRLLADRDDWDLTIAGDGPLAGEVRRDFAGLGQVNLDYLRYISEAEVDALLMGADVMLCPYRDASQSGVVVEATLTGMPSIVSPSGALPEQVDHGKAGYVMAEMSAAALAAEMRQVLEDRAGLAAKSAEVLAFWHRTATGNPWLDVVRQALAAPGNNQPAGGG